MTDTNARVATTSAIAIAVAGGAIVICLITVEASAIVLTVFGAIVIAEAVRPLVDRLSMHVPRAAAVTIVFAALVVASGGLWWVSFRDLAPQFAAFGRATPTYVSTIAHQLEELRNQVPAQIRDGTPQTLNVPAGPIVHALLGVGINAVTFLSTIAFALVLAAFWLGASDPLRSFSLTLISPKWRLDADALFRDLGKQLGAYASGTAVNGAVVAAASILVLWILRAPSPVVLGLIQGLLIVLPYIGTFIGVVAVGAVVLTEQGTFHAAMAIGAIALIASLEGSLIAPLVFKKSLNIEPFSTTLAIALGGTLLGTGGIVLAVPAAAVLQTIAVRVLAPAIRRTYSEA